MALGFAPKAHRARAKIVRKSIEVHSKNLAKDARKHNCKAALTHFANLAFDAGRLTSESHGAHKKASGKQSGIRSMSLKKASAMLRRSAGGKALNAGLSHLKAACSISKRRVRKAKK
jgi:hypothetical protein